ncbi:MAG: hypothetical protein L6Q66_00905 [Bacteroidia bacterium]|nr:hypothetical protein [Bacteroidia bacterium]
MKPYIVTIIICFISSNFVISQECLSAISIKLKNIKGGVYANQAITLTSRADGKTYTQKSNASGEIDVMVPCDQLYDISIANYTRKKEILSAKTESGRVTRAFTYEPDMAAKDKLFEMNDQEKKAIDTYASSLPDTISIPGAIMEKPAKAEYYTTLSITISDINKKPLSGEQMSIIGEQRKKNIKCTTDKNGKAIIYLLKGDKYYINFKYNRNYISTESEYSKGTSTGELNFSYLGTKEIEKRKKEEAERIALEAKRIKEEAEAFERKCKKLGITIEEGRRRETAEMVLGSGPGSDTVVSAVLNRNKWTEKLIVCDLTGSMSPYAAQLAVWYQLNYLKEKNLQFIFFNDGDNMPDHKKKIGQTGGIYYSPSKGIDSLFKTIAKIASNGWGGDCPENNMEALSKGVKIAQPYKELVMIADNNAPVKDISLLKNFKEPVHIILCGVNYFILEDYLNIAYKTKGSIHTMEEDITKLATMSEGQEIKIGKNIYKIMGGEFVKITKL